MNRFFTFFIFLTFIQCLLLSTANANAKENLIKQANEFAELVNSKEYTKVAFKINPMIVITMGGISQATDAIKQGFAALDSGSNAFKGFHFKEPDPILSIQKDLVAIVPAETLFKVREDLFQIDSFYIAWSSDQGKLWYFADGSGFKDQKSLTFLFPNYDPKIHKELKLPATRAPYKISPIQS